MNRDAEQRPGAPSQDFSLPVQPSFQKDVSVYQNGNDTKPTSSIGPEKETFSYWILLKRNWVCILTYCLVFWSFGLGVAFLGPTIFDLGCQTQSDMKAMNWVFFTQLMMVLIGSVSGGFLASRISIQTLLLVGTSGMALTMFIIPICYHFPMLLIDMMLMGWCMGCIDCVANLAMVQLFGADVAPFLQAMHFFYGLGAFTSPMIASQFIVNIDCSPYVDGFTVTKAVETEAVSQSVTQAAQLNTTLESITVPPNPHVIWTAIQLSNVSMAFYILGVIQLPVAFLVLAVFIKEWRSEIKHGTKSALLSPIVSPRNSIDDGPRDCRPRRPGQTACLQSKAAGNGGCLRLLRGCVAFSSTEVMMITVLTSAALFFSDGLQSSYAEYLYSYAEKTQELPNEKGAVMTSCFWGLFALGRLMAIPLALKCTQSFLLLLNVVGCLTSLIIAIIFRSSFVALYIGTCVLGLSLSSLSPTLISLTELFIDINPSIASCLVVCAALGETLCPLAVGNLFVEIGESFFLAFCVTVAGLTAILCALLYMTGQRTQRYKGLLVDSFIWLSDHSKKKAGESTFIKPTTVKYYSRMSDDESSPDAAPNLPSQETTDKSIDRR